MIRDGIDRVGTFLALIFVVNLDQNDQEVLLFVELSRIYVCTLALCRSLECDLCILHVIESMVLLPLWVLST